MSIRLKIIILMALVVAVFLGAILVQRKADESRTTALVGTIQKDQEVFFNKLTDLHGESLEGFVRDYTFWDEMVSFVEKPDPIFAEESIETGLTTFNADAAWVYGVDQSEVYSYIKDDSINGISPLTPLGFELLTKRRFLHYFIATNEGPLEIRAATIHPSDDSDRITRPQGYFLAGRLWDEAYVTELEALTGSQITIYRNENDAVTPLIEREVKNREGTIVFMRTLTGEIGTPLSYVSVEADSPIVKQSYDVAKRQFQLVSIFAISLIGALALFLLRYIGQPLSRLSESMRSRNIGIIEGMKKDTSEFGELAKLVLRFSEHEALEAAKAKDDALLLAIGSGIIAADKHHAITLANTVASELLGFSEQELLGKSVLDMITSARTTGEDTHPIIEAFTTGKRIQVPLLLLKRKNGTQFPALLTIAPVLLDGETVGTVLDIRDITKEREVDKAKTEFVSLVSHELRTPLTLINWFIKRFLKLGSTASKETEKHYLEEISKANDRMNDLVGAILEVSKLELGSIILTPEKIDIAVMVADILEELTPSIDAKKIVVQKSIDENLKQVFMDKRSMYIIMHNLIANAVKYNGEQGTLTIRIAKDGEQLLLSVADTGFGISNADKEKIFTKLFRSLDAQKKVPDGTGLGLYIVKSFVTTLKGEIWFESQEGVGTTFYVRIPLAEMSE